MVYHNSLGWLRGDMALEHVMSSQKRRGGTYIRKRSWGLAIFEKGTSASRAHEHSTTASPSLVTISLSAGLTMEVPLGLEQNGMRIVNHPTRAATHDTTIPRKRCPTLSSLIRPSLASFFPEHLRGSQWSKSFRGVRRTAEADLTSRLTHIATVTSILGG